jgi:PAS domain S-box-containing protein
MNLSALSLLVSITGLAAGVTFLLGAYAWRRRPALGAASFAVLMLAISGWAVGYALELFSPDLPSKFFWTRARWLFIGIVPVSWLIFTLEYTGRGNMVSRRLAALLSIEPVLVILLAWTNRLQGGAIYSQVSLDTSGWFPRVDLEFGWGSFAHIFYGYALLLLGTFLIVRALMRSPHLYHGQAGFMLVGAFTPWVANALSVSGIEPFSLIDLTPFAFTLTGLAMSWALFRFRMLDVVPVARDLLIENMSDGMLVLDTLNRVIDVNPVGIHLIGLPAAQIVGKPAREVLKPWSELVERYRDVTLSQGEIRLGEGEKRRDYDLRISPLHDRRGEMIGRLVVLRDITEHKRAEEELRQQNEYLTILHETTVVNRQETDALLELVLAQAGKLIDAPHGYIGLIDLQTRELVVRAGLGLTRAQLGFRRQPDQGLSGIVRRTHQPQVIEDYDSWPERYSGIQTRQFGAMVGVPLISGSDVIGVIGMALDAGSAGGLPGRCTAFERFAELAADCAG